MKELVKITSFDGRSDDYFQMCVENPDTMMNPIQDHHLVKLYLFGSEVSEIAQDICVPERDIHLRLRMFLNEKELARDISVDQKLLLLNAMKNRQSEFIEYVRRTVLHNL